MPTPALHPQNHCDCVTVFYIKNNITFLLVPLFFFPVAIFWLTHYFELNT